MKNFILFTLVVIANSIYSQNNYYYYSQNNTTSSDIPNFYNVDSVLSANHFRFTTYEYKSVDENIANRELVILGELSRKESFIKELDHTFIRDIGIIFEPTPSVEDTIQLKLRIFSYKDSIEANKVFKHLNKKIVSGIIVADYKIVYKQNNNIYFISIKGYHDRRVKKEFPVIINPIYESLLKKKDNLYMLFKNDLRIRNGN